MMPLTLPSMRILRDLIRDRRLVARRNNRDNATKPPSQTRGMTARSTTVLSPISRVPPELIDEIVLYLPASSEIAFRRCNKQLYTNGGPEPLNLLYLELRNGKDKDDHLWLLRLLERDAPQRLVCSICIAMHEKNFFNRAEISKPSESRKCRTVHICPHRSLTFSQLQPILWGYSTLHGDLPKPLLDCTDEYCTINRSRAYCTREVKILREYCHPIWSYNPFWKRNLYLFTTLDIVGETGCARRSKKGSLLWAFRLCPHVIVKDCCDCCRVDDPGRVELQYPYGDEDDPSLIRNGWVMRCKLCSTKIRTCESGKQGRIITVERCLGQGMSVEDAEWIRQTTPNATRQISRQQSKEGRFGAVAAYCSAIISDLLDQGLTDLQRMLFHSYSSDILESGTENR